MSNDCWDNKDSWVQQYRCGLHSGFPKCCIRFYVKTWKPVISEHSIDGVLQSTYAFRAVQRWFFHAQRALEKSIGRRAEYVMCPACVEAGNVVHSKPCPEPYVSRTRARWEAAMSTHLTVTMERT